MDTNIKGIMQFESETKYHFWRPYVRQCFKISNTLYYWEHIQLNNKLRERGQKKETKRGVLGPKNTMSTRSFSAIHWLCKYWEYRKGVRVVMSMIVSIAWWRVVSHMCNCFSVCFLPLHRLRKTIYLRVSMLPFLFDAIRSFV